MLLNLCEILNSCCFFPSLTGRNKCSSNFSIYPSYDFPDFLIFYGIRNSGTCIKYELTFASTKVLYTGFFLSQTDVVVVFTFVLVCNVIVVAQWRRLICFAREAHAFVCCFSRCLTYTIKWACPAVAGMVICRDNNKVRRNSISMYSIKEDAIPRIRAIVISMTKIIRI